MTLLGMLRFLQGAPFRRAVLVGLWCPAAAFAGLASIKLPATAVVDGPDVRLGQIAQLSSTDLDLVRRLIELPLGSVPLTRDGTVLHRKNLSRWVRSQVGLHDAQIDWGGEDATRITVASSRLAPKTLVDTAQEALSNWLAQRSERFEVQLVSDVAGLNILGDAVRLLVRPLQYERALPRMQVVVDVVGASGVVRSVPVTFKVTAYIKGLVAGENMAPGSSAASYLREQEVEVTAQHLKPVSAKESHTQDATSLRLRRGLRAGEVVAARDLEPVPAVQRGEWVTVRLVNGDVSMESRVEAQHDAQIGQTVRVKLVGAERSVLARVTGVGLVEVSR